MAAQPIFILQNELTQDEASQPQLAGALIRWCAGAAGQRAGAQGGRQHADQ